jgi:adenylosuccinate lyase
MGARLTDSRQYAHLWGTPELTAIFDEPARLQDWLDILAALAAAQARLGIIPVESADLIAKHADATLLDLDYVAEQTRLSAHSTLGLIRALQRVLPEPARAHVYFGATVQDVTDTWFALVMRRVGSLVWRDLRAIEESLLALAEQHRSTPMLGRTHGQPGAPISFGFKVASWADELRRHLDRLDQARSRWLVGQLAGAVGVLGFFESDGLRLRQEFCAELGLADPGISWLTARDRIAEFGAVLALVCGTLARIGNEVFELSRPEIGELREPTTTDVVSSITMPHKRNPEASEHLDTLARLVRAHTGVLLEGTVGAHERDGRAWKAEWAALPEVCLLSSVALQTARGLVSGLVVDSAAMLANLRRFGDLPASERVLAELSRRLGRQKAQQLLHELIIASGQRDIGAAVINAGVANETDVRQWTDEWPIDAATTMTDFVVRRAREARRAETATWP